MVCPVFLWANLNRNRKADNSDLFKAKTSWLYVAGRPILCDRAMEVAAMVSAINPAVNSGVDSMEVGAVQQELLWLLYDSGHLKKYPLAIGESNIMCWVILVAKSSSCQVRFFEHRLSFRQLGWLGGNHSDDRASKLFPTLRGKRSKQHQALLKPSRLPSYIPRR